MKKNINVGRLDTYFSINKEFISEPYLMLEHFYMRKAICKLRLSAHNLWIEMWSQKVYLAQKECVSIVL